MTTEPTREIERTVKEFLLEELLQDESPDALGDTTSLFKRGVLDSMSSLRLIAFLEERYGVEFEAHEVSADYIDTIGLIAQTVRDKLGENA